MKKLILLGIVVAAVYFGAVETGFIPAQDTATNASGADQAVSAAFESHRSSVQVEGSGRVTRLLPDDNDGSRHQRFILQLGTGQTVLVAHNTDLASRVASLKVGDTVEFNGEYEWNERGGVIHWTHRDPRGSHVDGWIRHDGHTYQ